MGTIKELPYGLSDFESIRRRNMYIVDKTKYIPLLEKQAPNLFLIRPRRFGKSLFLSMLESYYDVNRAARFDELFSDLWIGQNPTEWRNKYLVMKIDFSRVNAPIDKLEEETNKYLCVRTNLFVDKYKRFFPDSFHADYKKIEPNDANTRLNIIEAYATELGLDMYLIVDEYDNFTNTVLNEHGESVYHALTHAEGFYRGLFKKFKGMFARIFMMGVSPVTLDDTTSGFNIGWHISTNPQFNMMLGFSEIEVREMLGYYNDNGVFDVDIDAATNDMKPWYNNYCFSARAINDPKMFNCDMTLYYINSLISNGIPPKIMLSPNTKTDYNKMKNIIQLDKINGDRESVLMEIANNGYIYSDIADTYPALELTKPSMFISQLYYYGMLTIASVDRGLKLVIPNHNIRQQYYIWMLEHYGSAEKCIDIHQLEVDYGSLAFDGDWRPALEYIAKSYAENSVVRSAIEGERNVQGYIHAYFSLCKFYNAVPEMEFTPGYADMFLMPDKLRYKDVAHSYIIELKYVKSDATDSEAETKWNEGAEQVKRYSENERVKFYCKDTELHRIVMLFKGRNIVRIDEIQWN